MIVSLNPSFLLLSVFTDREIDRYKPHTRTGLRLPREKTFLSSLQAIPRRIVSLFLTISLVHRASLLYSS